MRRSHLRSQTAVSALLGSLVGVLAACGDGPTPFSGTEPSMGTSTSASSSSSSSTSAGASGSSYDDSSGVATTPTTTESGSSSADTTSSTGGDADLLVDRGLVVRYFLDEASEGQAPRSALDAAGGAPFDLPLHYALDPEQPYYVEYATGGGLRWTQMLGAGDAMRDIAGSKVIEALEGSTVATIEAVIEVDGVGGLMDRSMVVALTRGNYYGELSLAADVSSGFVVMLDNLPIVEFAYELLSAPRIVVHAVVDTSATADDRVRLYVDGESIPSTGGVGAFEGTSLGFSGDEALVLGNGKTPPADWPGLSPRGTIYYAAIYAVALTQAEIAIDVERLLADDDTEE